MADVLVEALDRFNEVLFIDEDHTYWHGERELLSVTKYLGTYSPFDAEGQAIKTAKKENLTPEQVLAKWELNRDSAALRGTLFHAYAEDYLARKIFPENHVSPMMAQIFQDYVTATESSAVPIKSEWVVYDLDYGLAGQVDQLYYSRETDLYHLADWKTSRSFRTTVPWKMKGILSHLPSCELTKYSLQLCMYEHFIKTHTDLPLGEGVIVWFDESTGTFRRWVRNDYSKLIPQLLEEKVNES